MASTVRIAILANAAQARRELGTIEGSASKLSSNFAKLRAPAAAVLAGIGLGAKKAVGDASNLNETINKSNTIFGSNSGAINTWASGAAKNLGLSKQAALDSAAGFGDMFGQLGFAGEQAAKMSTDVVGLSADLGSFNNLPTADVSDRISAAFRGEYDSLQALIPNINAARVESEAMAATGKKAAGDLTAQEKATAVLAIVQKDGARAQGDFARTSAGAANSAKIASASAADLSASLGQALLPAYTAVIQAATTLLGFLTQHQTAVTAVVAVLGGLAVAVLAVSAAQSVYTAAQTAAKAAMAIYTAAQWAMNAAMAANPIGLVVLAIVALVAVFVLAYKKSETFRNIVNGALRAVLAVAKAVWNGIKAAATAVWSFITGYVRGQINAVKAIIRGVTAVAKAVWSGIKSAASAAWSAIKALVSGAISAVKSVIRGVTGVASAVWNGIKSGASGAFNALKSVASGAVSSARSKLGELRTRASEILSKIRALFSPSALYSAGSKLIQGLVNGIKNKISAAVDAVRAGVQRIKNLLPGSPIKDGPLKSWNNGGAGKRLMGLLAGGIESGTPQVRASLAGALDMSPSVAGLPLGGSRASAGNLYQINVSVPVGGNMVEAGRQMVAAISEFERAGGRKRA